jgi:hypothetical protein
MSLAQSAIDAVERGRKAYQASKETSRQESRSAKKVVGVVGSPPIGGSSSSFKDSERYKKILAAKLASDAAVMAARPHRPRYIGPMKSPGSGTVPNVGAGAGAGGGPGEAATAGIPGMISPIYWLGIGAVAWLLLRKRKK